MRTFILIIFAASFISPLPACTIFCVSDQDSVLIGNNEDFMFSEPYFIKLTPKNTDRYARFVFYTKQYLIYRNIQGGVNEKGLFFDGASTPADGIRNTEMEKLKTPSFDTLDGLLANCKDVAEAILYIEAFNWSGGTSAHLLIADASGRSVILEVTNGQTHIIERTGKYQIATNYALTAPNLLGSGGWDRETKVETILNSEQGFSKEKVINALTYAAQKFPNGGTIYSNVVDLKNMVLDLFVFQKPSRTIRFDLNKEFSGKGFEINVLELFEKDKDPIYGQLRLRNNSAF